MEDINGYNAIIEENEEFFTKEFYGFDAEIKELLSNVVDEESTLFEIEQSLEESKSLRQSQMDTSAAKVTPVDNSKKIDELINWFIPTFLLTILLGTVLGAIIVTIAYRVCIAKQQRRLAELQTNPAFRFQETTDPSASHGGIPASNPIAHEDLMTSPGKVKSTDDGLCMSPDGPIAMNSARGQETDRQLRRA